MNSIISELDSILEETKQRSAVEAIARARAIGRTNALTAMDFPCGDWATVDAQKAAYAVNTVDSAREERVPAEVAMAQFETTCNERWESDAALRRLVRKQRRLAAKALAIMGLSR